MYKKEESTHICILYDSIANSVFVSQVLAPLINSGLRWHVISFESNQVTIPEHPNITFTILPRTRYWCTWSLRKAVKAVRTLLADHTNYRIIARGPFAGYIALNAATTACTHITIQARGLVAQEYAYAHAHIFFALRYARTWILQRLEHAVYSTDSKKVTIEAVSPALKSYLVDTFNAQEHMICLAQADIPPMLDKNLRASYKKAVRTSLGISDQTIVYCYNGSYKPWQCPQQTIAFFKQQLSIHKDSFLLILTPDIAPFTQYAKQIQLPESTYHICHVDQKKLYCYLAAADVGLLLREEHIINYVSRPTKALEYHVAGLCIMHSGTVDYIHHIPGVKEQIIS